MGRAARSALFLCLLELNTIILTRFVKLSYAKIIYSLGAFCHCALNFETGEFT